MKKFTKPVFVLVALLMILGIGSTLAFLIDSAGPVENKFEPSRVTCEVLEGENGDTFDGETKEKVRIKNTGDTPAYIRAAIVVTWKDAEGNVLGQMPELGTDYEWDLNTTDWTKGDDGFYYYRSKDDPIEVAPDGETDYLITNCQLAEGVTAPAGYGLNVEIICSAIQAGQNGPDAAYNAWTGGNN